MPTQTKANKDCANDGSLMGVHAASETTSSKQQLGRKCARRAIALLTIASFVTLQSTPVTAGSRDPMMNDFDHYMVRDTRPQASAMAYLRIPFTGGRESGWRGARLGLRLGLTGSANLYSTALGTRYSVGQGYLRAEPVAKLDLSVGINRSHPVQINGLTFEQINALYADEDGKKKGGLRWWHLALIGAAAFAVVAVIAAPRNCTFAHCD